MTPDEVMDSVLTQLQAQTPYEWYPYFVPDNVDVGTNPYGIVGVAGPFEDTADYSILGVEDQPYSFRILVSVVTTTYDAIKAESVRVLNLLRGWSPGSGVSALETYDMTTSFNNPYQTEKPSLYVRPFVFRATSNL